MLAPGTLIIAAHRQMYVTLGSPDQLAYDYDVTECDVGMQLDIGWDDRPGGAPPSLWPTRFNDLNAAMGDAILWSP
jgi:hypothetical protein